MNTSSRRILYLAVGGFPVATLEEMAALSGQNQITTEILVLTETNAREALEKIFSADGVAVWGEL